MARRNGCDCGGHTAGGAGPARRYAAGAAARHGGALFFLLPRGIRRGARRAGRAFCHPAHGPAAGEAEWIPAYGLKAFSPIAAGYPWSHYPDFGAQRSYGYARPHLGNDILGALGTPICAVEGGTVEALGWNRYGGWRIGIRSDDRKRYYYYAHLRKDTPYAEGLAVGQRVQAGEVIGFMGRTGYSAQENVNNIETVHLHFGLQLIFDESQKECDSEIWIDVYPIIELLASHCSSVARDPQTGRWERLYPYCDLDAEPLRSAAAR